MHSSLTVEDVFLAAEIFADFHSTTIINAAALVALHALLDPRIAGISCYSTPSAQEADMRSLVKNIPPLREKNQEFVAYLLILDKKSSK